MKWNSQAFDTVMAELIWYKTRSKELRTLDFYLAILIELNWIVSSE